jgi:tetraacyldisaccharide 4'-kinase
MSLDASLQRLWYGPAWRSAPLWPLEGLFRIAVATRSSIYRSGLLRRETVAAPVVVVGNLTVGGTGKTPVAAWLARQLGARGLRVGVVLRGYGGSEAGSVNVITSDSDPGRFGDEAVLHARRGAHVVVAGADRVAAARLAVERGAQVIVCDDGLQHLRLARDCEIVVVDAVRGLGNGRLLPAGPLREPEGRLGGVDAIVVTRRQAAPAVDLPAGATPQFQAELRLGTAVRLTDGTRRPLETFRGGRVYAIAGVGNPEAFFTALRSHGLDIEARAFPDHAEYAQRDFDFAAGGPLLMTEKDAVKCRTFARGDWWWVELELVMQASEAEALLGIVLARTGFPATGVNGG